MAYNFNIGTLVKSIINKVLDIIDIVFRIWKVR
jgi:hypothetical protein